MLDLEPATSALAAIVAGVRDDQLDAATPCPDMTVADLLDHVAGLALAFTGAARKAPVPGPPPRPDGARLDPDWRRLIPERLAALAEAWRDPAAWSGETSAGGVDMPGEVAAFVAIDEVVVHGWDLAVATRQPVAYDDALVSAAASWAEPIAATNPDGVPGLFGPAVRVGADASPLDRLLGATGRDPAWRAPVTAP